MYWSRGGADHRRKGTNVKAVVVYESLWNNTAAIARAVAAGIGPGTRVGTTDEISAAEVADADLIVAGAPVLGFRLGGDTIRAAIARDEAAAPRPPDLGHPSLRSWLESMPRGSGRCAAFETRIWWSPRGAIGDIERHMTEAGLRRIGRPGKFVVNDKYGPLRSGELERAQTWGRELARSIAD